MFEKAKTDYKTTHDREFVLNEAYDYAIKVLASLIGTSGISDEARQQWWNYCKAIDAELFTGLRIGTDYDYDNMLAFAYTE